MGGGRTRGRGGGAGFGVTGGGGWGDTARALLRATYESPAVTR